MEIVKVDVHDNKFDMLYDVPSLSGKYIYYVKGTNGSGKSTIPLQMANLDPSAYIVKNGKTPIATVFPNFRFCAIGPYKSSKSFGGGDYILRDDMKEGILYCLKETDFSIYFEGIMPANTLWKWWKWLDENKGMRELETLFMNTPLQVCLDRIQLRSGKTDKEIANLKHVALKHDSLVIHKQLYDEKGYVTRYLDTSVTKDIMLSRFLNRDFPCRA